MFIRLVRLVQLGLPHLKEQVAQVQIKIKAFLRKQKTSLIKLKKNWEEVQLPNQQTIKTIKSRLLFKNKPILVILSRGGYSSK